MTSVPSENILQVVTWVKYQMIKLKQVINYKTYYNQIEVNFYDNEVEK